VVALFFNAANLFCDAWLPSHAVVTSHHCLHAAVSVPLIQQQQQQQQRFAMGRMVITRTPVMAGLSLSSVSGSSFMSTLSSSTALSMGVRNRGLEQRREGPTPTGMSAYNGLRRRGDFFLLIEGYPIANPKWRTLVHLHFVHHDSHQYYCPFLLHFLYSTNLQRVA
jgi:hypothetical protein